MYLIPSERWTKFFDCKEDLSDADEVYTFYKLFEKVDNYLVDLHTGKQIKQPGPVRSNGELSVTVDESGFKKITGGCYYGYASKPIAPKGIWCFPIKVKKGHIIAAESEWCNVNKPGKIAFFKYSITYQAWSVVFKKGLLIWCGKEKK